MNRPPPGFYLVLIVGCLLGFWAAVGLYDMEAREAQLLMGHAPVIEAVVMDRVTEYKRLRATHGETTSGGPMHQDTHRLTLAWTDDAGRPHEGVLILVHRWHSSIKHKPVFNLPEPHATVRVYRHPDNPTELLHADPLDARAQPTRLSERGPLLGVFACLFGLVLSVLYWVARAVFAPRSRG
jgi:hypothetical protein